MSKYLYNNKGILSSIYKSLLYAGRLILFLDYDGTLTPIKKLPSLALPSEKVKLLLNNLSCSENVSVFIITGRCLKDIRDIIGINGINIISNHGLVSFINEKSWFHVNTRTYNKEFRKIKSQLKSVSPYFKGIIIEDKMFSIAIHYRNMTKVKRLELLDLIKNTTSLFSNKIKLKNGKKVFEIIPNINWDKGKAVIKMLRKLRYKQGKDVCIYIGDDKTDEDAFNILTKNEITIHVGVSQRTTAQYYLKNTKEVISFLEDINRMQKKGVNYDKFG